METANEGAGRILLVDDEPALLRALARHLKLSGYEVVTCEDGTTAVAALDTGQFDVLVSDISMPEMSGIQLLRAVREKHPDLPVVLMTGAPDVQSAIEALDYGAFKYLLKPVEIPELLTVVGRASKLAELSRVKRDMLEFLGTGTGGAADRATLEADFSRAMATLWMAFQPIIRASDGSTFGYEALLRTKDPALPHPGAVLDAAERLGLLNQVGRSVRRQCAEAMDQLAPDQVLFINLHPLDLLDPELAQPDSALSRHASRVVLEITERAALDHVRDTQSRIAQLRNLGYRIAVDDLGAGYAGLSSFAQLEPDIVKLDMSLVRDVDRSAVKQRLVESMVSVCGDLGLLVVAEGIETLEERDVLVRLNCDLLQGYRFGRPGPAFPPASW